MAKFIKLGNEMINLDLVTSIRYENDGEEPFLTFDFAAVSLNANNAPAVHCFQRTFSGSDAKALWSALDKVAVPVRAR